MSVILPQRISALCLLLAAFALTLPAQASQILRGHVSPAAQSLPAIRELDASRRLNLALGLPLRNRQALTNLLRDLYDPASPRFHHYLTAGEFTKQFGPAEEDYAAVARFAGTHGLTVTAAHANRTLLDISGTVADIEKALHLRLRVYQHPTEHRTFFAPVAEPMLDIDVPLLGISGLDDFQRPHPMNLKQGALDTNAITADFVTGSGPGGYFVGSDFRAAYAPGVALTGAGQSIGLFEMDGYFSDDIANYKILAKLPDVPLTNILLDGFAGLPGGNNGEVALDIDMAICMAPGLLQVMVYEGTVPNDVLNRMATDNQARQLSCSWAFYPLVDPMRDQIYQQFAAQGQSLFQASGDTGAYPSGFSPPTDDPNITVVGGTSLTTAGSGGAWVSETAWSGGGGGVSTNFSIPAWQQGVATFANHGSATMRNVPDVACLADVLIWVIYNNGQQGPFGGTSAAAPLWAGFIALANQQAAARGRPAPGFLNPALYAIGQSGSYTADFHDITTGNNTNSGSPTNFFAVPGYDLCTGWGTPTGSNLINALVSPPDALAITPAGPLTFSGAAGGPFGPVGQNFVLTNIGTNSFGWSAGANVPWLNPSPPGSALSPGGPQIPVALNFNSAAASLLPGSYTATVFFTNFGSLTAQQRAVVLNVVSPPAIIRQPSGVVVPTGTPATFTVGTATNALLNFQWQFGGTNLTDGVNVSGSSTSALTISNVNTINVGTYQVLVSNAAGVGRSAAVTLGLLPSAPVIFSQPASRTVPQGAAATFTVGAGGGPPYTFQWQFNATNLANGGHISGSSTSALTVANSAASNAGLYSVIVSNALGSVPSSNASLSLLSLTAPGVTLSTLYQFTGGMDGADPNGLMQDTNGNFYGTTQNGGANNSGTVFEMTPSGALTTIYSFNGAGTGASSPAAPLTAGPDGELYGSTFFGGTGGAGTLFKITTNGVLNTLVNFNSAGGFPDSALVLSADGSFYGTTPFGGPTDDGIAFRLGINGSFTSLASFNYFNGSEPNALAQAAAGNFYGTTLLGGLNGNGSIFELSSNGVLTSLTSFNYTNGGSLPVGGLTQTPDGNFYGTTYEGGAYGSGTIFQMSPLHVITTVYSFTGGSDGSHPSATLTLGTDGNLYGTATYGGAFGDGTVFRFAPGGALVSLAQFDGYDGANPSSALTLGSDGNLYGTTQLGGTGGNGVVFSVKQNYPSIQITGQPASQNAFIGANAVFNVAVVGNGPLTYQWRENGTNLADGPVVSGSATRVLTLLGVTPASSGAYSVVISNAAGAVVSQSAALGVITSPPQILTPPASQVQAVGGTAQFSVVAVGDLPLSYQWQWNGTNLKDGGRISGSSTSALTLTNVFETNNGMYSVIVSNAVGAVASAPATLTVYAPSLPGTTVATMHGFSGAADGAVPNALCPASDGLLYGTTQSGGAFGFGTVFSLSTNGQFVTLASFNGTNGATPLAGLVEGSNGLLYGTTELGGSNSAGTIFSVAAGGRISSIYSFSSNNDSVNPFTALTLDAAGNFYGAAQDNALPGNGTIFKMTPGGAVTTLYTFTNGTTPAGALALGSDGDFYGAAGTGQETTAKYGNIFRMTPGGAVANLHSFTGLDGYSPSGQLAVGDDGDFFGVTKFNFIQFHGFNLQFYGILYKVTPAGALTTLYTNDETVVYTDGAIPIAGLLHASDGNFYGSTLQGLDITANGVEFNNVYGTAFVMTPGGELATLTSFNNTDDGAHPRAALVEGADGSLYGTTTTGGPGGQGTICRISLTDPPVVTFQPASQTNVLGASAKFFVTVFGAPPLFYQWRQNGTNLTDGPNVSGSSSRVLTLNNLQPAQAGTYSLVVSNALGMDASAGAALTLEAPPFIQSVAPAAGSFAFTWTAIPQRSYQVQSAASLSPPLWTNLGGPMVATNVTLSASDSLSPAGVKFYRVLLLP